MGAKAGWWPSSAPPASRPARPRPGHALDQPQAPRRGSRRHPDEAATGTPTRQPQAPRRILHSCKPRSLRAPLRASVYGLAPSPPRRHAASPPPPAHRDDSYGPRRSRHGQHLAAGPQLRQVPAISESETASWAISESETASWAHRQSQLRQVPALGGNTRGQRGGRGPLACHRAGVSPRWRVRASLSRRGPLHATRAATARGALACTTCRRARRVARRQRQRHGHWPARQTCAGATSDATAPLALACGLRARPQIDAAAAMSAHRPSRSPCPAAASPPAAATSEVARATSDATGDTRASPPLTRGRHTAPFVPMARPSLARHRSPAAPASAAPAAAAAAADLSDETRPLG